jgi:hypothetical protein
MRLTDDLNSRRAIFLKGWLFLLLGLLAVAGLLVRDFDWQVAALLAIAIWAFCRWYYFAFYVIENYVDRAFRFDGIGSFVKYLWRSRRSG